MARRPAMGGWSRLAAAVAALALLAACTTLRLQYDWRQTVHAGDTVRVWKQPSGVVDLKVTTVSADAIEGRVEGSEEVRRVEAAEIRQVEKRQIDGVKTTKGIGIGLYATLTALFVALLITIG